MGCCGRTLDYNHYVQENVRLKDMKFDVGNFGNGS